jgi:hypothetical protein
VSEFTAHEQLAQLLGLDVVGIKVLGADLYGQGGGATLTVSLSNGNTLEFDPARTMVRPQTLVAELAVAADVTPEIRQPQAVTALAVACRIARTHRRMTEAEQARDWGLQYLQSADTIAVDTTDQVERWGAWSYLNSHDPWTTARDAGTDLARAGKVIHDRDGSRLVRTGWLLAFVRTIAPRVSHIRLPTLMAQAGWELPRRIKATSPGGAETLTWSFYTVPAEWETDD